MRTDARGLREHDLAAELTAILRRVGLGRDDCGRTTSATTVRPIPGVHALGIPMIGITRGSVIVAWKSTRDQPRPDEKRSLRTLRTPQDSSRLMAQSPASSNSGEPVEPGTVAIGQPEGRVHHLRPVEALVADPGDGGRVDGLGALRREGAHAKGGEHEQGDEGALHEPRGS